MFHWLKRILRRDNDDFEVTLLSISGALPLRLLPGTPPVVEQDTAKTGVLPENTADIHPSPLPEPATEHLTEQGVAAPPLEDTTGSAQPAVQFSSSPIQLPPPEPVQMSKSMPASADEPITSIAVLETPCVMAPIGPPSQPPPILPLLDLPQQAFTETTSTALATQSVSAAQRYYWNSSGLFPGVASAFRVPAPRAALFRLGSGNGGRSNAADAAATFSQPEKQRDLRPLARFVNSRNQAAYSLVPTLDPALFSMFLLHEEGSSALPGAAANAYLSDDRLAALGRSLRDLVLSSYQQGEAPLTPDSLLAMARTLTPDIGLGLLLCLNVTRAFARGSDAVRWQIVSRDAGRYRTETSVLDAKPVHPEGLLRATALSPPSLFYLLFSPRSLGTEDTGDWYRHFGLATLSAYASISRIAFAASPESWIDLPLPRTLDHIATLLSDTSGPSRASNGDAWLWANTVSFAEWGTWGSGQARADSASHLAIDAVRFGLTASGVKSHDTPHWPVPVAGALDPARLDASSISAIAVPDPPQPAGGGI